MVRKRCAASGLHPSRIAGHSSLFQSVLPHAPQQQLDAVLAELASVKGKHRLMDQKIGQLSREITQLKAALTRQGAAAKAPPKSKAAARRIAEEAFATEAGARRLVESLALALQCVVMLKETPDYVGKAFVASRLGTSGYAFGTLPKGSDVKAIVTRAAF